MITLSESLLCSKSMFHTLSTHRVIIQTMFQEYVPHLKHVQHRNINHQTILIAIEDVHSKLFPLYPGLYFTIYWQDILNPSWKQCLYPTSVTHVNTWHDPFFQTHLLNGNDWWAFSDKYPKIAIVKYPFSDSLLLLICVCEIHQTADSMDSLQFKRICE